MNGHERRKSGKRRSSFAPGRVSLLMKETSQFKDLYKQIPSDCEPADKFCRLARLSVQLALDKLQEEMGEETGFEFFKTEAMEGLGGVIDNLEKDGTFKKACENGGTVPNPINIQMDATIAELKHSINRLECEDAEWDRLLNNLEQQKENSAKQLEHLEISSKDIPEDVYKIAQTYLTGLPDLDAIAANVVNSVKTVSNLMDEYRQNVSLLEHAHSSACHVKSIAISKLYLENNPIPCSPKKLIQKMVSIVQ